MLYQRLCRGFHQGFYREWLWKFQKLKAMETILIKYFPTLSTKIFQPNLLSNRNIAIVFFKCELGYCFAAATIHSPLEVGCDKKSSGVPPARTVGVAAAG
jgi:hypothetical protein